MLKSNGLSTDAWGTPKSSSDQLLMLVLIVYSLLTVCKITFYQPHWFISKSLRM